MNALEYVRGTQQELVDLLNDAETLRQLFEIVVVQPGISVGAVTNPLLENLGAASAHVTRAGFQRLRVVASA